MADLSTCLPLTPDSIRQTHQRIKQHIHRTPVITSRTINKIASSQTPREYLTADPPGIWSSHSESTGPKFNLYFKCENHQKIGAFKARGAFSAVTHLASPPDSELEGIGLEELRKRGVITHSSGNHAQALALAASSLQIPAWIVMPSISTKSKISGTKGFEGVNVVFSGSTSTEREEKVQEIIDEQKKSGQGPILVPPYDHYDIMLGQGTAALELEEQYQAMKATGKICSGAADSAHSGQYLDAVLTPVGGGGLLSGTAIWNSRRDTLVFGCEPNFEGANDIEVGLNSTPPKRVETVKTLTIADGLRTPAGEHPWKVLSNKEMVAGVYSVSEHEIKMALKLMMERMKVFVEPSSAVPLAVVLFNQKFRQMVAEKQDGKAWDVGIIISGGNSTVEALSKLFGEGWMEDEFEQDRHAGKVGRDGKRVAENVAG